MDEPEVSLHPGAQKRFMQCLLSIIKKKKLQVIMTTHSASIVENLPPKAIVCLRRFNDQTIAEGNLNFQYAFTEIEEGITKKHIIVEDLMAKCIIEGIISAESLGEHIQVDYFPGGADNLKIHTIFTYAKTHITNRFIIFDGDQKPFTEMPDFSEVLEKDKTLTYYKDVFRKIVGVNADSIAWGMDANRKSGRKNEDQEKLLLVEYLEFYRNNVRFLPKMIPEDLIRRTDIYQRSEHPILLFDCEQSLMRCRVLVAFGIPSRDCTRSVPYLFVHKRTSYISLRGQMVPLTVP